uniref:Uncharacterized protein LOC111113921 isoform X2 n=1 Tax=Crassostrea virginica TaxID=6565 RepID=A0A8B8BX32_CRAVI|nr:uncharacterized protein LOC111113921 isoform X2 [Crassostrea virginica]
MIWNDQCIFSLKMIYLRDFALYKLVLLLCLLGQFVQKTTSVGDCVWSKWTEVTESEPIQHRTRNCGGNETIESRNCKYVSCDDSTDETRSDHEIGDPIKVIYRCPQTPSDGYNESSSCTTATIMSFVKDVIIGILFLSLTGITTVFCCQRKKREKEYTSLLTFLTARNSLFHMQGETLRSTTSSGYAIVGTLENTKYPGYPRGPSDKENTRPASCINVNQDTANCFYVNTTSHVGVEDWKQG